VTSSGEDANMTFATAARVGAAEAEARHAANDAAPSAPLPEPSGGGLDGPTTNHLGARFGRGVGNVRLHLNSGMAGVERSDAVTVGRDVHLAPGVALTPGLLAHEIAHVVQQTGGGRGLSPMPVGPLRRKKRDPEPTGDEPLDPFVTGWTVVPEAVLVAIGPDAFGLVPLRNAVYVPDAATAERFDPRVPRTPGTAPVFGVPAIGAGGTRIAPAGSRSAIIVDAGSGPGTSTAMYVGQFAAAVNSVGLSSTAELKIIPIHAHADHVNQIVEMIASRGIPPANFRIPRGLEGLASMSAVVQALQTSVDPRLAAYGAAWRPVSPADRGSGPEVIRLEYRGPQGLRMEMVGLRSAFAAASRPGATGRQVDTASYLTRLTHPDGTKTVILGDLRGADLERFRIEMERERAGSWADFFAGATRISGFSHHVGRLDAGDVRGIMAMLEVTLLATGKLELIEATNLGQHGRARADTLELLARLGVTVTTAEAPTGAAPSTVVATGRATTATGPDARARAVVPSQFTAGLARIVALSEAARTLNDWKPLAVEAGKETEFNALLREIETSSETLRTSLRTAAEAAAGVRTGGARAAAGGGLDYSAAGGAPGTAYAGALTAIPATTPAEASITPEGFRHLEYLRTLPLSDVPLRIAIHRAETRGEYSPQAFRAMLAELEPSTARSLLTGPRGGPSPVGKAFERVRAQWFTQTSVMPMPDTVSTSGMSGARLAGTRGVAAGLLVIQAVQEIGIPLYQSYKLDQAQSTERDLYKFARRILFWVQMGARPSILGVKDPFFSWSPTRVRGFEEVMNGLKDKKWDAVAIESPGLSDTDVFIIGVFLSQYVRNYDEFYELFLASGQDAVRWRGQPWESATWEIKVGDYNTTLINSVEEEWEKHDRLTELMRALVPRWIANTKEHLAMYGRGQQATEEDIARLGTFSHAENFMPALLYRAQLKDPSVTTMTARKRTESAMGAPHKKTFIEHEATWTTPPVFFVHGTDGDYLEVSGADFNTYTEIRPMWTEGTELGLPYSTVHRIANETATCLLPAKDLVRIDEPKPPPVPVRPTPARIEQRVYFPFAGKGPRTDANYDAMPVLDDVATYLRAMPLAKVRIVGHTDDVGEAPFNEKLSLGRASAVKALLEARGIAAERLTAEGGGKDAPIATNSTEDGRARNRRVEFVAVP
jgi:outer membrane protein OmpA-like peptidoglycan-associated protein